MGWDRLGWTGLGWAGLGWARLVGWAGLGWAGLGSLRCAVLCQAFLNVHLDIHTLKHVCTNRKLHFHRTVSTEQLNSPADLAMQQNLVNQAR